MISSSSQIHKKDSTKKIMWTVAICLLPAAAWGVIGFGINALFTLFVSIAAAVITEAIISQVSGKQTVMDGSAFLTGLLIGFNLPPLTPGTFYIPIFASVFAIAVIKWTFGGLGGNWMNPALAGRVFVFFSWSKPMTTWTFPSFMNSVDTVSGASPLTVVKDGLFQIKNSTGIADAGISGPVDFLQKNNYPVSNSAGGMSDWLSSNLGIEIDGLYLDAFFGNISGSIGEVSVLLLLIGAVYLFIKKIITWEIPVMYILSFSLLTWIFGGKVFGNSLFTGDVVYHLFTGGFMLGCLYMATDMVTTPLSLKGRIIFGIAIGFLTFALRFFGSFPEGVSLAIIIMNIFVPFIDRFTKRKNFGMRKKEA